MNTNVANKCGERVLECAMTHTTITETVNCINKDYVLVYTFFHIIKYDEELQNVTNEFSQVVVDLEKLYGVI